MTLKIGRLSKPELITKDLIPALTTAGEMNSSELRHITRKYGQKSYDDEVRSLVELTGLCHHYNSNLSVRPDRLLDISSEPEQRVRLLNRMPHFRKWLDLNYRTTRHNWRTDKVTIIDERDITIIEDFRASRFETWSSTLDTDLDESLRSRLEGVDDEPIYVTDECLFYNSEGGVTTQQWKRILALQILVAGTDNGIRTDLEALEAALGVDSGQVDKWISDYYDPLGVPVTTDGNSAWLSTSVRYESNRAESLKTPTSNVGDPVHTPVGADPMAVLVDRFENVFEPANPDDELPSCSLSFLDGPPEFLCERRSVDSVSAYIDCVSEQSLTGEIGIIAAAVSPDALRRAPVALLQDLLDRPKKVKNLSTPEWEVGALFRAQAHVAGTVPLIERCGEGLTDLGEAVRASSTLASDVRRLVFVSNPLVQYLMALSGSGRYTVRREQSGWCLEYGSAQAQLFDALRNLVESGSIYTVLAPQLSRQEVAGRLVTFVEKIGLVERDEVTKELDIPSETLNEFASYELLAWIDDLETTIQSHLGGQQ